MEFKVKPNEIQRLSSNIGSITAVISGVAASVDSAAKGLPDSSNTYQIICERLSEIRSGIEETAQTTGSMEAALKNIAHKYLLTEKILTAMTPNHPFSVSGLGSIFNFNNSLWPIFNFNNSLWPIGIAAMEGLTWNNIFTGASVIGVSTGIGSIHILQNMLHIGQAIPGFYHNGHPIPLDNNHHGSWNVSALNNNYSTGLETTFFDKDRKINPKMKAYAKDEFTAFGINYSTGTGPISTELGVNVGKAAVSGQAIASLFSKNGAFSPALEAKAKAEGTVLEGKYSSTVGDKNNNIHANAEGKVLTAEAEASVKASSKGLEVKAGAEAYAAKGSAEGGFTIFGIKFDAKISGGAGGASATAAAAVTGSSVSGKIGAGLGLGLDLEIGIDWSGFNLGI